MLGIMKTQNHGTCFLIVLANWFPLYFGTKVSNFVPCLACLKWASILHYFSFGLQTTGSDQYIERPDIRHFNSEGHRGFTNCSLVRLKHYLNSKNY